MTRYEIELIRARAYNGSFHLSEEETVELGLANPDLLFAWRSAKAGADYLLTLFERHLASMAYEY